jgi:predicted dehydrogenase
MRSEHGARFSVACERPADTLATGGMSVFNWAVVGPGRIAHTFARAVQGLHTAQPHAARLHVVCARDASKGRAFAQQWAQPGQAPAQVFSDLQTMLRVPGLDAVYIATPHAQHGDVVAACLHAGKAVLCEKPLVPNHAQALALTRLAQQRGVFLMEALWTRFSPLYDQVAVWLREHAIGPLRGVQSSFCFAAAFDPHSRLFDPKLAGGALLDIGIYNLSMTRWVLQQAWGHCPEPVQMLAQGRIAPTGVDQAVAASLVFEGGASGAPPQTLVAQMLCALDAPAENCLRMQGERGHIEIGPNFWQATRAVLHHHGQAAEVLERPFQINGFEGEIVEAMRCVRAGAVQSQVMPHAETLATLAWMDQLRAQLGVRYPFE